MKAAVLAHKRKGVAKRAAQREQHPEDREIQIARIQQNLKRLAEEGRVSNMMVEVDKIQDILDDITIRSANDLSMVEVRELVATLNPPSSDSDIFSEEQNTI
jgi:hypothetical protein